ncbi:unnamed protein product [Ilex paraguariensis]|uniref:MRG domain-containing protein n=1 Tax=Ilex paraguariensis TaxID=185542 RepID=A0ABC8TCG6_9AQUA
MEEVLPVTFFPPSLACIEYVWFRVFIMVLKDRGNRGNLSADLESSDRHELYKLQHSSMASKPRVQAGARGCSYARKLMHDHKGLQGLGTGGGCGNQVQKCLGLRESDTGADKPAVVDGGGLSINHLRTPPEPSPQAHYPHLSSNPDLLRESPPEISNQPGFELNLVKLPRSPSVDDILTKYLEYRSKKDGMMTDPVGEILNGLRCYFDKALPVILLYKKERQQYHEAVTDNVSPSSIYGAEHLLRLFVKLPELLAYVTIEEETMIRLQQKLLDFLKFLQKNQGTFFLSAYDGSTISEGSSKGKDS